MRNVLLSAVVAAAGFKFTRDISVAYIGVPLNVLFACGIGTVCAAAIADKVQSRAQLATYAFASWCMGAAFTAACNGVVAYFHPELKITDGLQAGMGAIVAFVTWFFLPWLKDEIRSGRWIDRIPFIKRKEKSE